MGEKKYAGYIFRTYTGDHPDGFYHVHIIKDKRLVGRWDIDNQRAMDPFKLTKKLKKALIKLGYMLDD